MGRRTRTSQASCASTDGTPYAPLADLLLHHRDPASHRGQLLDRAQDRAGGDPVGQVRDDLRRRRLQLTKVQCHRVGKVQRRRRGERVERVAQRRLERAVELDDVHKGRPRREVLGQHPQPAADLQHDVPGTDLRRARDHVEDVRVDQEVLP
jgi:hypothetical protein